MLRIYGQPRSRTFRVLWLAYELDIPHEHVPVTINVDGAQAKESWYAALNPNLRVPTIDDGGTVLWETPAINIYLAKKYGGAFYPRDAADEGRMLQWAFFVAFDIEPPMIQVFQNTIAFPPEKRNPAIVPDATARLQGPLGILDAQLGKAPFLAGASWGLADFLAASVMYTMVPMKFDLGRFPRVAAWLHASIERPAAKKARALRE
jgi:glutathione S-transferase